ncbi:MAG: aldehyde dehydrogenase family protein [Nocardiopsaceae bacterium]|nr:aldehyde dehydrogenase family protein [Nocardiopsaceae bacterium]
MASSDVSYDTEEFERMPIGGHWRTGGSEGTRADTDPYRGGTLVEITLADAADVDEAYQSARAAQREWTQRLPAERAEVLRRAADVLIRRKDQVIDWLIHESGSTRIKAEAEWNATRADFLEAASYPYRVQGQILPADVAGKESRIYRRPLGVVGVISPWNWPLHLSNRSVAPALAVGNGVVLKPASDTPVTGGLLLAKILEEAGLPAGLLNVIIGRGSEVGDPIVEHPIPRLISFTGSTEVGLGIRQKSQIKRTALELGGNGPLVVLGDADLGNAIDAAVFGSFFHQGQLCIRANRVIVDAAVHDEFVERFVDKVRGLRSGDPAEAETVVGPIINRSQLESIQDKISRSRDAGAEILLDGEATGPTGLLLPPHVLLGDNNVPTAAEEVFGPVATVVRAHDEDHALKLANETEHGLSSSVFTRDIERGTRFAQLIDAGMTHINDQPINDQANTAFGGEKESGVGRFGGEWAIEEFTTDHWISVQHTPRQFPM